MSPSGLSTTTNLLAGNTSFSTPSKTVGNAIGNNGDNHCFVASENTSILSSKDNVTYNIDNLPKDGTEQEKILYVLNVLIQYPLEKLDAQDKTKIFNYVESQDETKTPNTPCSEEWRFFMWCAIFQHTKSILPDTIRELECFIEVSFKKDSFSFKGANLTQDLDSYINRDEVFINSRNLDLVLIRKTALQPRLFIEKKEYDDKAERAAAKIQHMFKLKNLWRNFVNNPKKYKGFSNDKIATEMFGKHIARLNPNESEDGLNQKHNFVTTDYSGGPAYYRSRGRNDKSHFEMVPNEDDNLIDFASEGSGCTQWENVILSVGKNRFENSQTQKDIAILSTYAKNSGAILASKELAKLKRDSINNSSMNFAIHAQELYAMIYKVCSIPALNSLDSLTPDVKVRIEDNFARLHMFLDILVNLHNNNHLKFAAMLEPVVHELTLLVYEITEFTGKPVITYAEFNQAVQNEFLGEHGTFAFKSENDQVSVNGYPANSGMHANTVGLHLIKALLEINDTNITQHSFHQYDNDHYFEVGDTRSIFLGTSNSPMQEDKISPNIHVVNGSVLEGFAPYTAGKDLNELVNELLAKNSFANNKHHVILLDTTNTDYKNIKLADTVQELVNQGMLTIFLWESWQKMGLLGTDQVQYGRVVILSNKSHLQKLEPLNHAAEKDIMRIDMQIGALFQVCRKYHNKYREINFRNGREMRNISTDDMEKEKSSTFLVNNDVTAVLGIYDNFINNRDSFGFNYVTSVGPRVSAGTEPLVDIKIISTSLKKLVDNTKGERIKLKRDIHRKYLKIYMLNIFTSKSDTLKVNKEDFREDLKRYNNFNVDSFNKLPDQVTVAEILDSLNTETYFMRNELERIGYKNNCFNSLINDLNTCFVNFAMCSNLKDMLEKFSQAEIIELLSCLLLAQAVVDDPIYDSLAQKLNAENIIKICNIVLQERDQAVYNKLVNEYLEKSSKSISVITDLKSRLRYHDDPEGAQIRADQHYKKYHFIQQIF